MTLEIILGIILAGLLSNNYALLHFLGTGAVIENERSNKKNVILGLGTTIVLLIATVITWVISTFVIEEATYLRNLVFVAVVLLVVEVIHLLEHNKIENICKVDFTKFAINGAVLGFCIKACELSFVEAIITSIGVGLGFTATLVLFGALWNRVDEDAVPHAFHGLPIQLLTASMIVLALLCF